MIVYLSAIGILAVTVVLLALRGQQGAVGPTVDEAAETHQWQLRTQAAMLHNLGNVLTVAKLTIVDLQNELGVHTTEAFDLVLDDMLPTLQDRLAGGTLEAFLTNDAQGRAYLASLRELLTAQRQQAIAQHGAIGRLAEKVAHVSEVLDLQLRLSRASGVVEATPAAEIVNDASTMMIESAARHGIEVLKENNDALGIRVDRSVMTQVIVNLVKNAIDELVAASPASPCIRLQTDLAADGATVRIAVRDNGRGVDPLARPHIFDYGFTTKSASGSGLGLYFCRQCVERFGGRLELDTSAAGASFSVYLPLVAIGA